MVGASALPAVFACIVLVAPQGATAQPQGESTNTQHPLLQSQSQSLHQAHMADTIGHVRLQFGAMATGAVTRVSPALANRTLTEAQLVQPVATANVTWHAFAFVGALNGEGYSLKRGELNPGIFGEGYIDRRHPHTLVHEAMLVWQSPSVRALGNGTMLDFSLAAGKGFVSYGSDDPMMRPLEKYPVNHHYAQIIERVQGIAAARINRNKRFVAVEAATFNGDEPAGPFHGPRWSRVGDSRAARATVQLAEGVQLAGSRAWVASPEIQQGGAFNHAQHHASLRVDRPRANGDSRYLLAEWARTDEIIRGQTAFQYRSGLAEGAYGWHGAEAALRVERTDRAEPMRLLDSFRAPLGHIDFQILGVTQWQVTTVALQAPPLRAPRMTHSVRAVPFIELAHAFASPKNRPTAFEPAEFYGKATLWSLTAGIRLQAGAMRHRMGNYGVMNAHTLSSSHAM